MNTHDKIVRCRSCGYLGPWDSTCCERPDYDGATAEEAWHAAIEADRQSRNCGQCVPLSTDGTAVFIDGTGEVPLDFSGKAKGEYVLAKHQPCGCVICTCEDNGQCQGCGARHCGTHPIAKFSNPIYETPSEKARGEPVACFKCGHSKHGGECVNVAPQPADPSGASTLHNADSGAQNGSQAPQPPQIPEGYKLVPIEPTQEMQRAGAQAARKYMQETGGNNPAVIYEAMIEVAPQPHKPLPQQAAPQLTRSSNEVCSLHQQNQGRGEP